MGGACVGFRLFVFCDVLSGFLGRVYGWCNAGFRCGGLDGRLWLMCFGYCVFGFAIWCGCFLVLWFVRLFG